VIASDLAPSLSSFSLYEGAFMAVTDQKRTVVAVFGGRERADNAIGVLLKLGIPRQRIKLAAQDAPAELSSAEVDTYSEDIRRGSVLVSVSADSENEANDIRDVLDRHDVAGLDQVTGHSAGAERLSADENVRQGDVVDQGESLQATRRARIFTR
jgi:hypothetical protein